MQRLVARLISPGIRSKDSTILVRSGHRFLARLIRPVVMVVMGCVTRRVSVIVGMIAGMHRRPEDQRQGERKRQRRGEKPRSPLPP